VDDILIVLESMVHLVSLSTGMDEELTTEMFCCACVDERVARA
jgi:hypothetical protein